MITDFLQINEIQLSEFCKLCMLNWRKKIYKFLISMLIISNLIQQLKKILTEGLIGFHQLLLEIQKRTF